MSALDELLDAHPLPDLGGGKDDRGSLVIVGGPAECPGAPLLAATAALRTGAGRVQVAMDPGACTALALARPELFVVPWTADAEPAPPLVARLATADAVLVGVGCGELPVERTLELLEAAGDAIAVLDAGALAAAPLVPPSRNVVLAPNVDEARELCGSSSRAVSTLARELAVSFGRPAAVRGTSAAISDGTRTWEQDALPHGLGVPGSGDVFVGLLASLLASGLPPLGALAWAIQVHAAAGRRVTGQRELGFVALELADALPEALPS